MFTPSRITILRIHFNPSIILFQSYCRFVCTKSVDYLPRVYLTLLHFGGNFSFNQFLHVALDEAEFRWQEWIFNFDYCGLLTRIAKIANIDVIVRPYEPARKSICSDFLSILDLKLRDLDVDEEPFENVSLPLQEYVRMFLRNRMGRKLFEAEEMVGRQLSLERGKED